MFTLIFSIFSIIYLSGLILSYLLTKKLFKTAFGTWTEGDRILSITLSLIFSWLAVITTLILLTIEYIMNNDKPASW